MASPTGGRERGSGTMLAAGVAMAILLLTAMILGMAQAAAAAAKAATSADLAALAAADVHRGLAVGDACEVAAEVAALHKAQLVACALSDDMTVQVSVVVRTPLPWPAEGKARAGPPPDTVAPGG